MKPDVTRILIGGAVSGFMALALGWAFKWSDRQRTVVLFVLAFFVQGVLILVTQEGLK